MWRRQGLVKLGSVKSLSVVIVDVCWLYNLLKNEKKDENKKERQKNKKKKDENRKKTKLKK